MGLHVPRLAKDPCKIFVKSSILFSSTDLFGSFKKTFYICVPSGSDQTGDLKTDDKYMKSKITIDMAWDNQPIIKIEYEQSPDVRDKMVKKFMETFGGHSYFATFFYGPAEEQTNKIALIRPIEPRELKDHHANMKLQAELWADWSKTPPINE